ncbi:MAG TPA: glycosyl hydrolase, partial [Mariniphaga anaerophila]|nr:glycosyl hydrolase [Mariniphaga anaerophila]
MKNTILLLACLLLTGTLVQAQRKSNKQEKGDTLVTSSLVNGLKFRSIGPAWASGRIADFAVNPDNPKEYYVAVASGNVWKTTNNGTTWTPIFDNYGAYSIGVVTMDPNNHNVIWVGTGENNHQRALGYGDGVYKSVDGGKSFKNMGLKESRQIGGIVIDPRNSDVIFVAAEGSAWGSGGDRGLYKSTDGGKTWNKVLEISEHTGVNNVVMDPSNPDILYATTEQRRRTHFTKIGGGPESAVYKSTDNGETWRKIMKGLPGVHIGGMGIDVSPVNPNYVYLIVEAAEGKGGFFRSTDKGESWEKMSNHHSSGQYYNEIFCDPVDVDKIYSVETYTHFTTDGGKTWTRLNLRNRHVDDHALWIDPADTDHLIIGGDGG